MVIQSGFELGCVNKLNDLIILVILERVLAVNFIGENLVNDLIVLLLCFADS